MKFSQVILLINILFLFTFEFSHSNSKEKFQFITEMPKPPLYNKDNLGWVGSVWSRRQYIGASLSYEDGQKHRAAVYNTLDNLPDLKVSSWFNKDKKLMGAIRVLESEPISGGYCRYYQVVIQKNSKIRNKVIQGCKYIGGGGWSFKGGGLFEKP